MKRTEARINGVDEIKAYDQEEFLPAGQRMGNGWGGSQTRLKKGHLARRDTKPVVHQATGSDKQT